jgi:hypothetical protein
VQTGGPPGRGAAEEEDGDAWAAAALEALKVLVRPYSRVVLVLRLYVP